MPPFIASILSSAFLSRKALAFYGIILVLFYCFGSFYYIKHLRQRVATLKASNENFVTLLQEQSGTIDKLQTDYGKIVLINQDLVSKERTYQLRISQLNNKFTKTKTDAPRDFGKLALAKPLTIQRAIIKGTHDKFVEIEILTGWMQDK